MAVTEVSMALGSWAVRLRSNTPKEYLDALKPMGHIAIVPGRVDVAATGDGLLQAARYVGVYRARFNQADEVEIKGVGMSFWLGDEDHKGDVFETGINPGVYLTWGSAIAACLPASGALVLGNLTDSPSAAFPMKLARNLKTPRQMLEYVTSTFSQTPGDPLEYQVTGHGRVNIGKISSLYPSTANPQALLVRKDGGKDMVLVGVEGSTSLDTDTEDYTTRVILLAEGTSGTVAYGYANGPATPYKDLFGNAVKLTRVISESDVAADQATTRAQVNLLDYQSARQAAQLSTDEYDVKGTFGVGDSIWVHDVEAGFTDPTYEVIWHGVPINPIKLRISEMTWPLPASWTVAYRDPNGLWFDLSEFYAPEQGGTSLVVGEFLQRLGGSGSEPIGGRPSGDSTVPGVPAFGAATTAAYQSDTAKTGDTKAQVNLTWSQPLNDNGTAIIDGAYYRIRFRPKFASGSNWTEIAVSWGTLQTVVMELTPGTTYTFQIRAEDLAVPSNVSAWSASLDVVTAFDSIAPSAPAAPTVAASRIAIQVTHTLGKSSGGTYNLETDLDHLEVHAGASAAFTPSAASLLGNLQANIGLIIATIPAVGTFNVESTAASWIKVIAVDRSGNKSTASTGASATALLIDNAHISDLTVSKVTAGTMTASWVVGGTIATALSGARVQMNSAGIQAYNTSGSATVSIESATGDAVITGTYSSGFTGGGPYLQMIDSGDRSTIYFLPSGGPVGNKWAYINSPQDAASASMLGMNTGSATYATTPATNVRLQLFMANSSGFQLGAITVPGGTSVGGSLSLNSTLGQVVYRNGSGVETGGRVLVFSGGVAAGMRTSGADNGGEVNLQDDRAVMEVSNTGTVAASVALFDDSSIWMEGRFSADNAMGGDAAVYCGTWAPGSAGTFTVSYGVTMATRPQPIYAVHRGAFTIGNHALNAFTTTAFTVEIQTVGAINLNYWCFRTI